MKRQIDDESYASLLGCDTEIILQAVMNGIWFKLDEMVHVRVDLSCTSEFVPRYLLVSKDTTNYFLTSMYKQCWWLKKDRSM